MPTIRIIILVMDSNFHGAADEFPSENAPGVLQLAPTPTRGGERIVPPSTLEEEEDLSHTQSLPSPNTP